MTRPLPCPLSFTPSFISSNMAARCLHASERKKIPCDWTANLKCQLFLCKCTVQFSHFLKRLEAQMGVSVYTHIHTHTHTLCDTHVHTHARLAISLQKHTALVSSPSLSAPLGERSWQTKTAGIMAATYLHAHCLHSNTKPYPQLKIQFSRTKRGTEGQSNVETSVLFWGPQCHCTSLCQVNS